MKITSIKDPLVVAARALQSAHGRKEQGKALLFGLEQLRWALDAQKEVLHVFIKEDTQDLLEEFSLTGKIIETSEGILKKISNTNYTVPVLSVIDIGSQSHPSEDFVVVLDNLVDYGNIGSIIRTSLGFSIHDFILTNTEYDPYQRKIIDASRGLVFQSNIKTKKNTADTLAYLRTYYYP